MDHRIKSGGDDENTHRCLTALARNRAAGTDEICRLKE